MDSGHFINLNYPSHYLALALDSKHVKKFDFHKEVAGNQVNKGGVKRLDYLPYHLHAPEPLAPLAAQAGIHAHLQ